MTVSDELIVRLQAAVTQQLGWKYAEERSSDLMRGVTAAAKERGYNSLRSFVEELLTGPFSAENLDTLSKHLTVGETYFWREPQSLTIFKERVLPQLLATPRSAQKPLRIWSAGCSTGEEAYSLAILLCEALPKSERSHISVLATDINPVALQKARGGIYSKWSFRGTPEWLTSRYLHTQGDGTFQVIPEIRQMISFSALNLAASAYPAPWGNLESIGTIWCRNVLIYFANTQTSHVLSRFYRALEEGGYLIVAPCETARVGLSEFKRVTFPEMTFFRKQSAPQSRPALAPTQTLSPSPKPAALPITSAPRPLPSTHATSPTRATSPKPPAKVPFQPQGTSTSQPVAAKVALLSGASAVSGQESGASTTAEAVMETVRGTANTGQLERALHLAQEALVAYKLEPGLHYLAATILQELGRLEEATTALKKAVYLDSDFVLAHFALANLARRRGLSQEAERQLNTTLALLNRMPINAPIPESEGLTAGQLKTLIMNRQKGSSA